MKDNLLIFTEKPIALTTYFKSLNDSSHMKSIIYRKHAIFIARRLAMRKENSTNYINEKSLLEFCRAHKALAQISGRWKLSLLFALQHENLTYGNFKSILPDISDRILSKQLKELVEDQIIYNKKDKVQSLYILTEKGKKIVAIVTTLGAIESD